MNIKQRIKILIEFPPQQQFIDRHFSGVYKGNLLEVVISRLLLYEFCCFVFLKRILWFCFSPLLSFCDSLSHTINLFSSSLLLSVYSTLHSIYSTLDCTVFDYTYLFLCCMTESEHFSMGAFSDSL